MTANSLTITQARDALRRGDLLLDESGHATAITNDIDSGTQLSLIHI